MLFQAHNDNTTTTRLWKDANALALGERVVDLAEDFLLVDPRQHVVRDAAARRRGVDSGRGGAGAFDLDRELRVGRDGEHLEHIGGAREPQLVREMPPLDRVDE